MIIFNTTFQVDNEVSEEWCKWVKETYIPLIKETSCFKQHYLCQVISNDYIDGKAFSLQLFMNTEELVETYISKFAPKANAVMNAKYGEKVLSFSTILREI